jgi:hypothetical protein
LDEITARNVIATLEEIGRLTQGMIDKAESFCSAPRVAEDVAVIEEAGLDDPLA